MERLSGGSVAPSDEADIKRFVHALSDRKRLEDAGLVRRGAIAEGTHLVLAATPRGEVMADGERGAAWTCTGHLD